MKLLPIDNNQVTTLNLPLGLAAGLGLGAIAEIARRSVGLGEKGMFKKKVK